MSERKDVSTIAIRREADGEVREYRYCFPVRGPGDYLWTEGNYACDCNRYLFFERAGGMDPHWDEGLSICGESAYTLLWFQNDGEEKVDFNEVEA